MKALIADDNSTNRKLLRVVLEAEGITIVEARDGVEGLAALEREAVDFVVSDVLMPNKDGYELCHALRKKEAFKNLPFLFYTNSYTTETSEKLAYEFGASGFVTKPATAMMILEAVRKIVEPMSEAGLNSEISPLFEKSTEASQSRREADPFSAIDGYLKLDEAKERLLGMNHKLLERTEEFEHTEERLQQANILLELGMRRRADDLVVAKEDLAAFFYVTSEMLKRPLRIIGNSAVLLEQLPQRDGAESKCFLRAIGDSVKEMVHATDSLHEFAAVGRSEMLSASVDLSALVKSVVEELRIAQPLHDVEIKIDRNLWVQGDRNILRIALKKLLENAWKYTASQLHPKIQFALEKGYPSMTFSLRDNGAGFAPQSASRLFGDFASLPGSNEFPGIGLGLATVKRIIQRHGGRVWAQSEINHGAVFYFTIPSAKIKG